MKIRRIIILTIHLLIIFLLSACGNNNVALNVTTTPVVEISQSSPTKEETPTAPQPTEVLNSSPSIYIYLSNSEIYFPANSKVERLISEFEGSGMEVMTGSELPSSDQHFSYVLLFNPTVETINFFDAGLSNHLLVVSSELPKLPTTRTTLFSMSPADRIFVAGYLAAIITEDWRVGGLLPSLEYENTPLSTIFQNGVEFMCGRCLPIFGPLVNFPVTATLTNMNDTETTMQAFSEIYNNRINSLYIPSSYLYDDFVILLQQNGITIISDSYLENDKADWVDYAIVDNLNELVTNSLNLENQSENFLVQPVSFSIYSKFENFPSGKANFIQRMMDNLQKGYISPYSALQE